MRWHAGRLHHRVARQADAVRQLPVRGEVQQDRGVGQPGGVAADVAGLALPGVGAEQQDVQRLLGRVVLTISDGRSMPSALSMSMRGDVPVQVPVDEEPAGEHDDEDHGQGDGHGLEDTVPGQRVSMARRIRQRGSSGLTSGRSMMPTRRSEGEIEVCLRGGAV